MKVKIKQKFVDKYTGELYTPGSTVEMTEERVEEVLKVLPNSIEASKAKKAEKPKKAMEKPTEKKDKETR